jgi:hypothetical protein
VPLHITALTGFQEEEIDGKRVNEKLLEQVADGFGGRRYFGARAQNRHFDKYLECWDAASGTGVSGLYTKFDLQ